MATSSFARPSSHSLMLKFVLYGGPPYVNTREAVWLLWNLFIFTLLSLCPKPAFIFSALKKVAVAATLMSCSESDLSCISLLLTCVSWTRVAPASTDVIIWVPYSLVSNCALYQACFVRLFCSSAAICISLLLNTGWRADSGCVLTM